MALVAIAKWAGPGGSKEIQLINQAGDGTWGRTDPEGDGPRGDQLKWTEVAPEEEAKVSEERDKVEGFERLTGLFPMYLETWSKRKKIPWRWLSTSLEKERHIFHDEIRFIFTLRKEEKNYKACMYIIWQDLVILPFADCVAEYDLTWATGVWLVLVRIGPSCHMLTVGWSCHSLLLVELFIDAFTLFPQVLFGLATLIWGAWLGIFGYTHVHASLWIGLSYIHSKMGDTHIIYYIDRNIGVGWLDSLFLTPSVGHRSVLFPKRECTVGMYLRPEPQEKIPCFNVVRAIVGRPGPGLESSFWNHPPNQIWSKHGHTHSSVRQRPMPEEEGLRVRTCLKIE
jgi:hypothetical protein